jgi:hypothetical protein
MTFGQRAWRVRGIGENLSYESLKVQLRVQLEFTKLPGWIQQKVKEFGVSDPENWIKRKIPALGDRSVLETLKSSNGEEVLRNYFAKVIGRF